MIYVKKTIENDVGTFKICSPVLNEEEVLSGTNVVPVCADDDYIISFRKRGDIGVCHGRKHFSSVHQAEAYILTLYITGFSVLDL